MPCDDCRDFRREMYELKEFVAKWFSVLLKRFDVQDRKLMSLTEAICGEDICDIMGDVDANLHTNCVARPNTEHQQVRNEKLFVDKVVSNRINDDDFKIENAAIPLSDFTNDSFLSYNDSLESPTISIDPSTNHSTTSSQSKRKRLAKPNRKPFPLVEFKERSSKAIHKPSLTTCKMEEDEDFEKLVEEIEEEINSDDVDLNSVLPSTSSDLLEDLHEGQRFDTMKDFMSSLTKYEESQGINLIVADSKKVETANKRVKPGSLSWDTKFKYCYFELRCSRAGVGEQCPFRLLVINSKTERRLVITKMVDAHHQLCAQNGSDEAARLRLLKRLL